MNRLASRIRGGLKIAGEIQNEKPGISLPIPLPLEFLLYASRLRWLVEGDRLSALLSSQDDADCFLTVFFSG